MSINTEFDENFNFRSVDWGLMKPKLVNDLQIIYDKIVAKDCSHDEANQLRGRAGYIRDLLAIEMSALKRQAR